MTKIYLYVRPYSAISVVEKIKVEQFCSLRNVYNIRKHADGIHLQT